jgi:hypothetical protein
MSYRMTALRGGAAALALAAVTTFAAAQEPSKEKLPQGKERPTATQPMSKAPAATEKSQSQQENRAPMAKQPTDEHRAAEQKPGKAAEDADRAKKGGNEKATTEDHRATEEKRGNAVEGTARATKGAANEDEHRAAEEKSGKAANVKLSADQRTKIRTTVLQGGASRVTNVNFIVTVGTVVPRGSVEIIPVPATLVEIEPEWRGFLYFVYGDEIVLVDPSDMTIVAVVAV